MDSLYSLININLERNEMICLVGAGGKTSTMFRLAGELSAKGKKVLVTTTTAIYYPEEGQYDSIVVSEEETADIFLSKDTEGITMLGRRVSSEGKLLGVNPLFLDDVFSKGIFDYILVEGDGSKGRPVKAPAEHEPVIPKTATMVIGLIGLDCMGKAVCADIVHRPEIFCGLLGCSDGDAIDAEMLHKLIIHREGLFKAAPIQAKKYLVLNKADSEKERTAAADVIQKLLDSSFALKGIIVASMKASSFQNAAGRVSGVVLASGLSRRMGANKLLLPIGGIPVIEKVIAAASDSMLEEIILVCTDDKIASIGRKYGAVIVNNLEPQLGQSNSVRLGVENSRTGTEGYMFMVGDQPFITAEVINRLLVSFSKEKCSAAVPFYNGQRGNPVVFSSGLKSKLLGLSGDAGGRKLLDGLEGKVVTVAFDNELIGLDIDTPEEYKAMLELEDKNG